MSGVAFYPLAALVVAAALAVALLPGSRQVLMALCGFWVTAGVLFAAAGATLLGLLQIVVPILVLGALLLVGRRTAYIEVLDAVRGLSRRSPVVLVSATGFAAMCVIVFAGDDSAWHRGSGVSGLLSVFHYRAAPSIVVALVTAVAVIYAALLIGRHSDDERQYDHAAERRREREERMRRRREDRAAARGRRREAPQ